MKYIEKKGNIELTYEIEITDRELLETILSDIVTNTSYTTPLKEHKLPCDTLEMSIENEIAKTLPDNVTPIYTEVSLTDKVVPSDVNDKIVRPYGHPIIIAVKRVVPELAYILRDMLDDKDYAVERFLAYEDDGEMVDIDERISSANDAKDVITEFTTPTDENIKVQKSVFDIAYNLDKMKKDGEVFDTELLRKLYNRIAEVCTIRLVDISGNGFLNLPVNSKPAKPLTSMLKNVLTTDTYKY